MPRGTFGTGSMRSHVVPDLVGTDSVAVGTHDVCLERLAEVGLGTSTGERGRGCSTPRHATEFLA